MAAVYRPKRGSRVVMRGRGRELHIDGSFASYYEPGSPITGSVWDGLAAAVLALPPSRRRSVLILGLGGGSAARAVRALAPRARIVAVEVDPRVVRLARQWFDLDALAIEVILADARDYLARSRGRFDAVLEDLFVGTGRKVVKPEGFPAPGLLRAARRLSRGGVLASNALDEARQVTATLRERFPRVVCIEVENYDNRILIGGGPGFCAQRLRRAVARDRVLAPTLPSLRFRTLRR